MENNDMSDAQFEEKYDALKHCHYQEDYLRKWHWPFGVRKQENQFRLFCMKRKFNIKIIEKIYIIHLLCTKKYFFSCVHWIILGLSNNVICQRSTLNLHGNFSVLSRPEKPFLQIFIHERLSIALHWLPHMDHGKL